MGAPTEIVPTPTEMWRPESERTLEAATGAGAAWVGTAEAVGEGVRPAGTAVKEEARARGWAGLGLL